MRVLYAMWDRLVIPEDSHWASREESLALILNRSRNRSRRVLEHLFRAHSSEVLEAVVDCWQEQVAVSIVSVCPGFSDRQLRPVRKPRRRQQLMTSSMSSHRVHRMRYTCCVKASHAERRDYRSAPKRWRLSRICECINVLR